MAVLLCSVSWQEEAKRDLRRLDNEIQDAQDEQRVRKSIEAGDVAVASARECIKSGDIRVGAIIDPLLLIRHWEQCGG